MFLLADYWEQFGEIVKFFGVPGAIFLAMIYAIGKGWLIPGREVADRKKTTDEIISDLRKQLVQATEEREEWQKLAWDNQKQLGDAMAGLELATRKLTKSPRSHLKDLET